MRRIVFLVLMAFMALGTTQAQRVYKQIYDAAYKVASDPNEDPTIRKIESFKVDAITYLNTKTLSQLTDESVKLTDKQVAALNNRLDSLAYYMYDYVNLFTKEYSMAKNDKQRAKIMEYFRIASYNTPLYNDPDKDLVLAYYYREDYLTRFSLDTDWILANRIVRQMLRDN